MTKDVDVRTFHERYADALFKLTHREDATAETEQAALLLLERRGVSVMAGTQGWGWLNMALGTYGAGFESRAEAILGALSGYNPLAARGN